MAILKIKVPKTPRSAFNKNRPASELLKAQLEHLEAAAGKYADDPSTMPKAIRSPRSIKSPRAIKSLTENDVATRIYALTRKLQLPTADEQPAAAAVVGPVVETPARARRSLGRRAAAKKSTLRKGGHKPRQKG